MFAGLIATRPRRWGPERRPWARSPRAAACLAFAVLALVAPTATVACHSPSEASARKELAVFAAASLTEAFQQLAREFEASHANVDVRLTFAGSQVLRLQIAEGARADVFASASEQHMQALVQAGHASAPVIFAASELVVIVPPANPARIRTFADLGRARRIVVGTHHVPIGIYTREMLERARRRLGEGFVADVEKHIVSEESNVRLVRAKVELGEADAAVVYRTDVASSRQVHVIEIPKALNPRARYPVATLERSARGASARAFVAFVLSRRGRRVLRSHGFLVGYE